MGGPGSGNHYHWWRSSKKAVVEDCLQLDATRWRREGLFKAGALVKGNWQWTYHSGKGFTVNYQVNVLDLSFPFVQLTYSWIWTSTQQQDSADYRVRLVTTQPQFGGLRWWFICPLVVNSRACGRRVGKLYLPPPSRYFGCRRCYDLTYRSTQEHDKRVGALRRNPESLLALMSNPNALDPTQLLLALQASSLADY